MRSLETSADPSTRYTNNPNIPDDNSFRVASTRASQPSDGQWSGQRAPLLGCSGRPPGERGESLKEYASSSGTQPVPALLPDPVGGSARTGYSGELAVGRRCSAPAPRSRLSAAAAAAVTRTVWGGLPAEPERPSQGVPAATTAAARTRLRQGRRPAADVQHSGRWRLGRPVGHGRGDQFRRRAPFTILRGRRGSEPTTASVRQASPHCAVRRRGAAHTHHLA